MAPDGMTRQTAVELLSWRHLARQMAPLYSTGAAQEWRPVHTSPELGFSPQGGFTMKIFPLGIYPQEGFTMKIFPLGFFLQEGFAYAGNLVCGRWRSAGVFLFRKVGPLARQRRAVGALLAPCWRLQSGLRAFP